MSLNPRVNDPHHPLVSVLIFNYNYGRYLRECFESVLAQTYDNIEINFSDNASTDESWEIALEYQHRYPEVFFVARNRENFGSEANIMNCLANARGKYFVDLCSDDAILPEFVRRTVEPLEQHADAAFAIVHRSILNEHGTRCEEPPFYNESCRVPGAAQAAVYMMAAVNPSVSQIMYRKSMTVGKAPFTGLATRYYGTRIRDFNICCEHPILYIKDPLVFHRLHLGNDSFRAADNLMEVIGPYVLNLQFADTAAAYRHQNVTERVPTSIAKIAQLALRYSVRALLDGGKTNALRYFHLSIALAPNIAEDEIHKKLSLYWQNPADSTERVSLLSALRKESNLVARSVSYDPPPGSVPI